MADPGHLILRGRDIFYSVQHTYNIPFLQRPRRTLRKFSRAQQINRQEHGTIIFRVEDTTTLLFRERMRCILN